MRMTWRVAGAVAAAAVSLVAPSSASPRPSIVVDGVRLVLAGRDEVVAVRLDDPATLVVHAGYVYPGRPDACSGRTRVRLLSQDAAEVRVEALYYRYPYAPRNLGCVTIGRPYAETRLTLAAPLGGRGVVANDVPVTVHDRRDVLRFGPLPHGVAREGTVTFDARSKVWRTVHAGPRPGQSVSLRQGPPENASAYRLRPSTVRGRPAQVGDVFGGWCVWWRETPAVAVSACSQGSPAPLTLAELLAAVERI